MSEQQASATTPELPPYGYMHEAWMWDVRTRRVPVGFSKDGRPVTAREYAAYLDAETREIGDFLWPRYDRDARQWVGKAREWMHELTAADLDLMDELRPMLLKAPQLAGKDLDATHQAFFEQEDETRAGEPLYATLDAYVSKLPADSLTALKAAIKKMSVDFGPAPLRYKEHFQRPRPYQVAYLYRRSFAYEFGRSAVTPSLVSGHCMQGLVRHAAGYLAHRLMIEKTPGALQGLQQHAADYGDRRVYAGVHYPSDNISSWYCSLRLCDHLYGDAGAPAKRFIRTAIETSKLYHRLLEHVAKNPKSVYKGAMDRLEAEARREPFSSDG